MTLRARSLVKMQVACTAVTTSSMRKINQYDLKSSLVRNVVDAFPVSENGQVVSDCEVLQAGQNGLSLRL